MSRTKTNRTTDGEQYTRSNAATATLLTLVKPAETLVRDWPNTNERRGMVMSTITLLSTIYIQDETSNWLGLGDMCNVFYRLLSTSYFRNWFTNLEQTPLNRSQQLPAPYKRLVDESSKTNYLRTTGELTIWLTIDGCLTVTTDGSKRTNYWLRVFIANNITA